MSPEERLYAALKADVPLMALVHDKVFADRVDQEHPRPYLVYQRTGSEPTNSIHGDLLYEFSNITIFAAADTREKADEIAEAVRTPLYAAKFWKLNQAGDFEDQLDATSVAVTYRTLQDFT